MRIGLFTDFYMPHQGGVETAVLTHAQALRSHGHDVTVVCPKYKGAKQSEPGILRLETLKSWHPHMHPTVTVSGRNKAAVSALKLDIVHMHTDLGVGHLATWYAHKYGTPLIQTIHTNDVSWAKHNYKRPLRYLLSGVGRTQSLWQSKRTGTHRSHRLAGQTSYLYERWLLKKIFSSSHHAKAIIVPSLHFMEELKQYYPEGNYAVVPNAIDLTTITPRFEDPTLPVRILWIGRVSAEKRPLVFMEVIKRLSQSTDRAFLVDIIGNGPELTAVKAFARRHNLDNVRIHGGLPYDKVKLFWELTDVFVLTSHNFDTQAIVLVEAAASGAMAVLSDKNLASLIAPQGHVLANGPDPASVAEALSKTLIKKTPKSAQPIRAYAEKTYSLEVLAQNLENIYKN
ncbi:MAG: glycosyltransferase family 4 protein [Patescibacteria group bacterium]